VTWLAVPAIASAASRSWSGPVATGNLVSWQYQALSAIACPSADQCTGVDSLGRETTFDPSDPGTPRPVAVDPGRELVAIDCPSLGQCTALSDSGDEVTFDPSAPGSPTRAVIDTRAVDDASPYDGGVLHNLDCPTASQCTAVDGDGYEITFNPMAPGAATGVDINGGTGLGGIACSSKTECIAVGGNSSEVAFDPQDPGHPQPATTTGDVDLGGVSCPSAHQCTAVGSDDTTARAAEVTFDPAAPTGATTGEFWDGGGGDVVCVSTRICITDTYLPPAMGEPGGSVAWIFDPNDPGEISDLSPAYVESGPTACPTASLCVVLASGTADEETFDPATAIAGTQAEIAPWSDAKDVACPLAAECVDIALWSPGPQPGEGLPDEAQLFDPSGASSPSLYDTTAFFLKAVACPAANQCTAVGESNLPPDGPYTDEATFDPTSQSAPPTLADFQGYTTLSAVACPFSTECVAIDDTDEITFDPTSPSNHDAVTLLPGPSTTSLSGIACPSIDQCTVVDSSGAEMTFDPAAPGTPSPVSISGDALVALACPSVTQCTADDATGVVTFDPLDPGTPHPVTADAGHQLGRIACPSLTDCVAVDDGGDAVEGDPGATGSWTVTRIPGADSLVGISCSSAALCVAVDDAGSAWAGVNAALPVGQAPTVTAEASSVDDQLVASLSGEVDPQGVLVTDCELQWASGSSYSSAQSQPCDQSPGAGTAPVTVTAQLSGLSPGTTYHYRFVAETTAGVTDGDSQTFATPGVAFGGGVATTPTAAPAVTGTATTPVPPALTTPAGAATTSAPTALAPPAVTGTAPAVSLVAAATRLRVGTLAPRAARSYRVRAGDRWLRLTLHLSTTSGRSLADELIDVVIGSRTSAVRTGADGSATLVLARPRNETIKLRCAGTPQDAPSTTAFRIVVSRSASH
jgi:hypothetical protein